MATKKTSRAPEPETAGQTIPPEELARASGGIISGIKKSFARASSNRTNKLAGYTAHQAYAANKTAITIAHSNNEPASVYTKNAGRMTFHPSGSVEWEGGSRVGPGAGSLESLPNRGRPARQ